MANQGLLFTRREDLLEWFVGLTATAPTGIFAGLWTADPGDTGASGAEITGTSYARVAVSNTASGVGATVWHVVGATDPATVGNLVAFAFPTAGGNWNSGSSIPYLTLHTASTAGSMLARVPITGGITVLSGNTPQIAIDALKLTCAFGT